MKNKLLIFFLFISSFSFLKSKAQTYGNEWINYNQSYYKFRVYKDSIYRISIADLNALGMPSSVLGANLQIFREGQEVPIYVSSNAALTSVDYIEFYGEKANGKLDAQLYKNPNLQLNPELNLISDTAYYFVTFNSATNNKRFNLRANNLIAPPLKETYFWKMQKINYRGEFSYGKSDASGASLSPVYYTLNSSQYEEEGYVRKFLVTKDSVTFTCTNPYTVSGGPFAYFKTTIVGKNFFTNHQMKIYANSNLIADSSYGSFDIKRFNLAVPMSYLNAQNKISFRYEPVLNNSDRYGVASIEFRYPSLFNFENKSYYPFELDPKATDYYLEITNFNSSNVAPRLYDLISNEYITGDISTAGIVKYLIPASTVVKKFVLINQSTNLSGNVIGLENITFKNFSLATNQGNYLIISHKNYADDGTGHNYLNDYKTYRSSTAGGAYLANIAFTDDIYNEFGYGYDYSCLAIKNYITYAQKSTNWTNKPKQIFLVGKGIKYPDYLIYKAAPFTTYPFYAVPSFGHPSSDLMYTDFTKTSRPEISIGRLSAFNTTDIKNYLEKVIDYEEEINSTTNQTSDDKIWQKRFLHIAGTKKEEEQIPILASLSRQAQIISSPYFGGIVTTIKKGSTSSVESVNSKQIDELVNNGTAFIQFFGHSSSSTLDYNLDLPENYKNYKKYPHIMANGCGAGNIFEPTGQKLLSERYVLTPNGGAISFIANVNTGFSSTLGTYTDSLYNQICKPNYGKTIGEQLQNNVYNFMNNPSYANDGLFTMHCQQILINGDPALKMYGFSKPDYAVEDKGVTFKQNNLTSTIDSIDVQVYIHNLGKYTTDSVNLYIKRVLPNNIENVIINKYYPGIANSDTLNFKIATEGEFGLGQNYLEIKLDEGALIDEVSESNNSIRRYFTIYNDDLVPVYPYEYSIVNTQGITLKGSTLNSFADERNYIFQIDTTNLFNSPLLKSTSIASKGGVVKWQPLMTLKDSTVYYWRTAMDTLYGNHAHRWTNSSFIYIDQSLPGWNQSHYYQFQNDSYSSIDLDSLNRKFTFSDNNRIVQVQNVCMNGKPPYTYNWSDYWVKVNGESYTGGCATVSGYSSLQFVVIDTLTGETWKNYRPNLSIVEGRFGSFDPCKGGTDPNEIDPFFEFSFRDYAWRQKILNFLDSIPQGYYVMAQTRLCVGSACGGSNKFFVNSWKADTTILGSNNSLYHKMKNLGFDKIDSLYKNRPVVLWARKGMPATAQQYVGADSTVKLYAEFNYHVTSFEGNITSTKIGPAKVWSEFKRNLKQLETSPGDTTSFDVYGISLTGAQTLLTTIKNDTSLSFINATQYPYLKIVMNTKDNNWHTAEQLKYWRVLYQPQPEAALNPNRYFVYKDTLGQGQISKFSVAVENLTTIPMDSLLVKYSIIDKANKKTLLGLKRYKPLPILDTMIVDFDINSSSFTGSNILEVEVNPDNDQAEQYHPNNIGLRNLFVVPDNKNPLIDVTFDGVHILDKDIVSAKPFINITLKDENKYLALDDTSLVSVYLRYNSSSSFTEEYIPYDNNRLKFIPAILDNANSINRAKIEFKPEFTKDGDDYLLIVKAKDKTGNIAGSNEYKVGFRVVTAPSISSLLNYPNPFTTSTQFLFTITGSEIPSNIKIQILSPTGKVVREITKGELGNLHIGRNLTEFKWNGDDQFGQPLANGVYLYRLVSNMNGNKMDHHITDADKWTEKGYGKLYIMR